jgi:hypothetical protein
MILLSGSRLMKRKSPETDLEFLDDKDESIGRIKAVEEEVP